MPNCKYKEIDPFRSFQLVQKQVEAAVRAGELSNAEAYEIIKEAKASYKNQDLNRYLDRTGRMTK